jgi:hypothetical protein
VHEAIQTLGVTQQLSYATGYGERTVFFHPASPVGEDMRIAFARFTVLPKKMVGNGDSVFVDVTGLEKT